MTKEQSSMTDKRRVGRPRTRSQDGPGDAVGFRAPRYLKRQLEDAAAASGRSISTEAQFRLENSFREQQLFDEALDTDYGEGTAGIVALLKEVIRSIASTCLPSAGTPGATWTAHPTTFDQAVKGINLALETLRPPGDPDHLSLGDMLSSEGLAPGTWTRAGEVRAAQMLHAVTDPDHAFAGLGPRAKPLAKKLGLGLVDRIRAADPDKIRRGLIEEMQRAVEEANR
jgi:hypothetical protein